MYIIIAILAFGILIAGHEFGHFITAKLSGVKVNEFAIGMGPAIFKRQRGETLYSLRILPLGGYCAMEGEDEAMDDERAFTSQPAWKRVIILAAGSFMNFLIGFIAVLIIYSGAQGFAGNTVVELVEGFKYAENGIQVGDEIHSIDGHRVYYSDDFSTYMARSDGTVDMVVIRGGEKLLLKGYGLRPEYYTENGEEIYRYGLAFEYEEATVWGRVKFSCYTTYNFVRMVWLSLSDLISGNVGVKDMAGVVGIVDTINQVGEQSASTKAALMNIGYLCAFIAVNLAVMNMLPIPALDGGRIFALLVTVAIEKVTRKKLDPKIEGYVHAAGLVVLLGLMAYVMFNDVMRIIK